MAYNCVKYHPHLRDPWMVIVWEKKILCVNCALDLGDMSLNQGHDMIAWYIIKIQLGSHNLWPGHRFLVCVHCDHELGDMTLGQGHDTPLGHGQQLCEILSRSNLAMRRHGPDTDFGYVRTVTLTLEIWPWVKVMTHPSVIDNKCVKYYPDPTWQWGVMALTLILGMCALWPWRYDLGSS